MGIVLILKYFPRIVGIFPVAVAVIVVWSGEIVIVGVAEMLMKEGGKLALKIFVALVCAEAKSYLAAVMTAASTA
jgi:hypothetical protein